MTTTIFLPFILGISKQLKCITKSVGFNATFKSGTKLKDTLPDPTKNKIDPKEKK